MTAARPGRFTIHWQKISGDSRVSGELHKGQPRYHILNGSIYGAVVYGQKKTMETGLEEMYGI